MKKISALIFAAAGVLNAQTYDYDPSSETLVITGKGNSVADRITLEGPTTPGSTVPGSTEIFGDTTTIILKDVWTSPDSTRIKYIEPSASGRNTTLKLINSRLGASGDFDMGGSGQTLIIDAQSELNLYGNRLTNTTRIENDGYIETTNGTISESSYLWDNKTGTGSSGVLGGRGYYSFGNVSSIETDKDFGLIKSRGRITDLEISGEYTVGGDSGKTVGDNSFFAGVNAEDTTGGQAMTISGKLTVAAKQGTGIGVRANQLGDDDASLENNYSGEIIVKAKDAFGVKVGGNAAKDAAVAGDIYSLSIGTLNVESTASGSDTGTATGIYAKNIKRGLAANSIAVKGYTDAVGVELTEGGKNLSIADIKVSAGENGTATGIRAPKNSATGGELENIDIGNMEVSGGSDAAGIVAKSVSGKVGNVSVSSTNGTASGISADTVDITVGGKFSAASENGNAYGVLADNDIKLTLLDGAEISAAAANGESFAIRSANGNADLNFAGTATINGNVRAKDITLSNGGSATINGDVEGDNLTAGAEIGTVSGKMKFDTVADLTVATSVGSLEIGTAESIAAAKIAGDATIDTVKGKLTVVEGGDITINVSAGELLLGTVDTVNVAKVTGTTDIIAATGDVIINEGGDVFVRDSAGSLILGKVGNVGAAKVVGNASIDQAGDVTIVEGKGVTIGTSADSLSLGTVESVYAEKINGNTVINEASQNVYIANGRDITIGTAGSLSFGSVANVGVAKVNGNASIDKAGDITIIEGGDVTVTTSADSLSLGRVESVRAEKVNGDTVINEALQGVYIVEGQNVSIGTAGSLGLDKVGDVGVAKVNGETTIGEAGNVIISEGKDVVVNVSADSLTLGTVENVRVAKVGGATDIIAAAGNVRIDEGKDVFVRDSAGSLDLGKVENVGVAKVNGDTVIGEAKGITIIDGKNVWVNVSADSLTLGKVDYVEAIKINGDTVISEASQTVRIVEGQNVTIGSANSVELGKVADVGIAKVNGETTIDEAGDVTIVEGRDVRVNTSANSLSLGAVQSVYAEKVNGNTVINEALQGVQIIDGQDVSIGSAGWIKLGKVGDVGVAKVAGTTVIGEAGNVTIIEGGNVHVDVSADSLSLGKVGSVYAAKINGDTVINEASQGVQIAEGRNVSIGTADYISLGKVGDVGVAKVEGNAVIGEAGNVIILEGKDVRVNTSADSLSVGKADNVYAAKVNGETIISEASQNVYIADGQDVSIGSAGSLNVDRLDGNLTVAQVGETVISSVAGDIIIGTASENVSVSDSSSATIVNASGDISAANVANGLSVGNVGNVNVSNADVNVLDGGTVVGDIVSSTDFTLTNGGSATIAGSVSAGSNRLTIGSAFNINSSAATVISAGTLAGAGLRDTINSHYDNAFGFSATDDSAGTLTAATSLKGTHNVSSNNITGTIEGDLASVENAYTKIKYKNVGNNVGYEVESNTYLTDAVATNETEKAYARIYDNLEYVEGDDAANASSVAKKRNFAAMVNGGTLGALNPQSVVHSVRMNMDLADIIHLDTLNRTSSSVDALAAADHAERPNGTANITVRNINRFASYGGDGTIDGSNDYITGGLANVEYALSNAFFAGFGAGGFQSKSTGKGNCGKAETQSFAVNAYADWRFFDNFDWYFGATYAFGMNEAERTNILDKSKAEWNSNLVGVFTGVRYAWKPFIDREFYLKPTIGANANFLMNPSFDEKSGAERMHFDSDRYTSVKSLVGIEATYALPNGFYFAGRMFYTHEFCDERYDVNSVFGASAIRTRGWEMDRDAGVFGAGLGYNITDQWRVYADYAAEVSGKVYHNLNAGIQFRF